MNEIDKETLERINTAVDKCADVIVESKIEVSDGIAVLSRLYAWIELESGLDGELLQLFRNVFFQAVDIQKKTL